MTTLIGRRCTHSNVFSRPVLIGRGLGFHLRKPVRACYRKLNGAPVSGGHSGRVTPVPIPNTEVKPASADGTWGLLPWESRSPPELSGWRPPPLWRGPRRVRGGTAQLNRSAKSYCPPLQSHVSTA